MIYFLVSSLITFLLLRWLFRIWLRRRILRIQNKQSAKEVESKMLQCYYCGLYIPQSEAVIVGSYSYCSSAHAQAR
jgi:hypothetical protein